MYKIVLKQHLLITNKQYVYIAVHNIVNTFMFIKLVTMKYLSKINVRFKGYDNTIKGYLIIQLKKNPSYLCISK